jgi:hypothetical protein
MSRPFLDLNSEYVKSYFNKIESVVPNILKQDFSELEEYQIPNKYQYGDWKFRVVKSPPNGVVLQNFVSDDLKQLVFDENILLVSINKFGPKSTIKEHKDPAYFGKNTFRIMVPLKAKDSYLTANFGTIKCEEGKPIILDFIYETHSGENKSDEDFIVIAFDVFYEKDRDYQGSYFFKDVICVDNNPLYQKIAAVDMGAYEKL